MGRRRAAVNRLLYPLSIAGLLLIASTPARASWSLKDWVHWLLQWRAPSPEESALAPAVPTLPPTADLLRVLQSRIWTKRLAALDALVQSKDTSPQVLAGLIRATQDSHREISDRAFQALSDLCQTGHSRDVMNAFAKALAVRPEPRLYLTGYNLKILDPTEEARAEATFKNPS